MRDTIGSVTESESRGFSYAALGEIPEQTSVFPRCIDPHCGCAACLHRCTQVALAGGIPTNGEWWKIQGVFPVIHGGVAEQVDGFFAVTAAYAVTK
jgi:hypothetical protein